MTKTPMFFACAMLVLSASAARAQEHHEPLPSRLSAGARATIERLRDSLTAERLPAYALRDKAAEGVLKGADDARIVAAVQSLAQRLRDARAAIQGSASDDEIIAGASALFSGARPDALRMLAATKRQRDGAIALTIPFTVLAELAVNKVPPDVALSTVDALLSRGAKESDFGAFRLSVERDLKQGRAPRDAVAAGMRSTLQELDRSR